MDRRIHTIDGPGKLLEVESFFGNTQYRVAGNGFEGWYAAHEILSDLDEDETTTLQPGHNESPEDDNVIPFDETNDHHEDGTVLPWDPEPTAEWDGNLSQEPDGADISLTPTNSVEDADFDGFKDDEANHIYASVYQPTLDESETHVYDPRHAAWVPREQFEEEYGTDVDSWPGQRHANVAPRQAFLTYLAMVDSDEMIREAAWMDVRKKAKRLWDDGSVEIKTGDNREIFARVTGDTDRYDVEVHRKNAFGKGVTWWDCACEWGKWAYKRERTFVGRMCSHALAAYYAMQSNKAKDTKDFVRKSPGTRRDSLASRQGGLMIWDDDLHKVIKNLIPQGDPSQLAGGPPGTPMSADPSSVDPATGQPLPDPNDPSAMAVDGIPADGGPGGMAGDPLAGGVPPFVRSTPAEGPTGLPGAVAGFIPGYHYAGDDDETQNTDDYDENASDFVGWAEPNSEDAETFNDLRPWETPAHTDGPNGDGTSRQDDMWNKSSAYEDEWERYEEEPDEATQQLQQYHENNPVAGEVAPTSVPYRRARDDFGSNYPEDAAAFVRSQGDPYDLDVPDAIDLAQEEGLPRNVKHYNDDPWADAGNYPEGEAPPFGLPNSRHAAYLDSLFADDDEASDSELRNTREAATFNEEADDIVAQFQRSAAGGSIMGMGAGAYEAEGTVPTIAQQKYAGRNFTYAEQQELIDEPGSASQLDYLNLDDSIYS